MEERVGLDVPPHAEAAATPPPGPEPDVPSDEQRKRAVAVLQVASLLPREGRVALLASLMGAYAEGAVDALPLIPHEVLPFIVDRLPSDMVRRLAGG